MKHTSLLLLCVALTACQPSAPDTPALQIADRLTWSEPPTLIASGLEPGAAYTLKSERISGWNAKAAERSELTYRANENGTIDTSRQRPTKVSDVSDAATPYLPIRQMAYLRETPLEGLDANQLRLVLSSEDGIEVLSRTVGIGPDFSKIVEEPLGEAFQGAFIMKRSDQTGPAPVIVALGGSEGGDSGARSSAPLLASEGYVVLGLPYYSPAWGQDAQFPDLPSGFANIPVDYLERAVAELRKRPDADPDRISLYGVSKGAEFVLLAGALIPDDSAGGGFCGIVADVPSDVVWEGWGAGETVSSFSWRGEPLPFVPYANIAKGIDPNDDYTLAQSHTDGREANSDRVAPARIRVETIDEPVLVIGGGRDDVWPSAPMARNIKATRDRAGLETESYVYDDAGHGVGGTPLVRTRPANLEARIENFPATMAFLERVSQREDCRS